MKKSFFIFFVCCVLFLTLHHQVNAAPNDPVNIPDANLRAVLEQKLGKTSGATITEAEMASITTQISMNTAVSDLTGLQYATGVTNMLFNHQRRTIHNGRSFWVTDNDIRDLSPLRNLTQLEVLNILHQDLTDISPLENLTALRELTLWRRHTSAASSALVLTSLANKTNLYYLLLSDHVEDLSPLRGLTGLTNLILNNNRIVDLSPLRNLTALVQLSLGTNQITDISPLSGLTNLEELVLRSNVELSDISPVRHLTKLKELWLLQTRITHSGLREVLPSLGSLKRLILQITRISDLSVVDAFPSDVSLASLDLRYIGTIGRDAAWLLTDITPLVGFVQAGKMGPDTRFTSSPRIELHWNLGLDYESIYEDLPTLINYPILVNYHPSEPALEREFPKEEVYKGHPRTRYTFVVRAVNNTTASSRIYRWPYFAKVPVTWEVTAPDGTVEETDPVLTGSNGLVGVTITLGNDGETHTVEAVVPENRPRPGEIEHDELRVTFTVTADRTVPPPRTGELTVTFEDYPEETPKDEFTLTIKFSEPVIGFEKDDITVETELKTGIGTATLKDLNPTTGHSAIGDLASDPAPLTGLTTLPEAEQSYTATIELPYQAAGTVKLIVREDAAITPSELIGPETDTISEPIAFDTLKIISFLSRVAMNKVIFNEFRNAEDDKNDYLELKNISEEDISLADWVVKLVIPQPIGIDRAIVTFPDATLPPGGILLIVNTDPRETDLLRGQNFEDPNRNPDLLPQVLIAPEMKLPQTQYVLILRSTRDRNVKWEGFEDLLGDYVRGDVGYRTKVLSLRDTQVITGTSVWFSAGKVYQRLMQQRYIKDEYTIVPKDQGYLYKAWALSGYHSGLGYAPGASPETSLGTPGYPEVVMTDAAGWGQISISEVMYATDEKGTLSQWIELYNASETEVVDLQDYELVIEARDSRTRHQSTKLRFKSLSVMPNQTVLLVSQTARNSGNIPARRLYDVYTRNREAFLPGLGANNILGSQGFGLRLLSPDGTLVDIAGNIDGQPGRDKPQWTLPGGWTEAGARTSLIRVYEDGVPGFGTVPEGWVRAADTALIGPYTYYGHATDDGTPGYRLGSPLPVTLSSFRADRGEGAVIVKWTTASEMDNAGFNILRSETKKRQFVKVNPTLILGAGTTAEQNVYTYTDTTAKSNVAYYYQIEEVSLSGERQAVATVRLRGHLSATGKLLWKWADVKSVD